MKLCAQYGHPIVYGCFSVIANKKLIATLILENLSETQTNLFNDFALFTHTDTFTLEAMFQPQVIQPFERNRKLAALFGVLAN